MRLPTSTLPVNAILSTSGCATIARARRFAEAGDDVDDAGRKAGVVESWRQLQHRQRRLLGRLEHHRAARADRRRELPRGHQQRVVPRDDLPGDADRLAQREAHRVVGDGHDVAVDLGREAAVVLEAGRDVGDVELGSTIGLPLLSVSSSAQLGGAVAHDLREPEEDPAALLRRRRPSTGPSSNARARGVDGAADVVRVAIRRPRDQLLGRRIDDVDRGVEDAGATSWPSMNN